MKMARRAAAAPLLSAVMLTALNGCGFSIAAAQAPSPTDTPPATPTAESAAPSTSAPAASDTTAPAQATPAQTTAAPNNPSPTPSPDAAATTPPAPATTQAQTPSATPETTGTITPSAVTPQTDATPAPAATDPATPPATPPVQQQAQTPPPPPADPVVAAVREKFSDNAFGKKSADADRAAAAAFYLARSDGPVWVKPAGGFTPAADAAIAEIRKADDWGLTASTFTLPRLGSETTPQSLADAEATMTLAVLEYAREARGGRINPQALSPAFDLSPTLKDPKVVLDEVTKASNADAYLRDLHPKHEQFVRLREALLKLRAPTTPPPAEDESLSVKLPPGKVIKPGAQDPDVSLLRRRLKVMAEAGNENIYDEQLQEAVMAFQRANGVKANGYVGKSTRTALNGESGSKGKADPDREVQRIINNMERWRWMPTDLGAFYVWNNIPEFKTRVMKDGKQVYDEKIVVGLPQWVTPSFSARMRSIVFHPEWGVPDGIKTKELQPQLRRASGSGFFEDLFGGGGGGSRSAVLRRHGLNVSYNGRPVDPDSVDWNSVDIRRFQFTQPAGATNVLGIVKFLFPNKHDVYMHDTTAKELFKQNMRAYSHGCMRVNNPVKFAELLLHEDKGWSPGEVDNRFNGSNEVKIDKEIWVHTSYFTAVVDDSGKLNTFADVYGFEPRVAAALSGKEYRFEAPPEIAEVDPDNPQPAQRKRKQRVTQTDPLTEAISGLFAN